MKLATFNAFCPVEIGDRFFNQEQQEVCEVTDIACVHYVKSGQVEFRYQFNGQGAYKRAKFTQKEGFANEDNINNQP